MQLDRFRGYILAALAAALYGTNPVFAVPLYTGGMNPTSVLLFRYILSVPIIVVIMLVRNTSFSLRKEEVGPVAVLGILMSLSSLGLFASYEYLNAGVASTLLFIYPIMVAVMMIFFFHEKFKMTVAVCLVLMSAGLLMLMKPQEGGSVSMMGLLLVFLSSLTYALYIVMVNVSKAIRAVPTTKLLFYTLVWGCILFLVVILVKDPLTMPEDASDWMNLVALAVLPTAISLFCTTRAIQLIGSTPTAILGALEPVTAVIMSFFVLGQPVSLTEICGGLLIIVATTIVVGDKGVEKAILHVKKMFPRNLASRHNKNN